MGTIIGLPGSLRRGSHNAALLRAAASMTPAGTELEIVPIDGIPLYNGDLEEQDGLPEVVVEIKARLAAADGLIMATPEYNNGVPGVFKNAIDWLSRGGDIPHTFGDIPVALIGAGGRSQTRNAQNAWLPTLRVLGARPYFEKTLFSSTGGLVDAGGELADETVERLLRDLVEAFAAHCERLPRRKAPA